MAIEIPEKLNEVGRAVVGLIESLQKQRALFGDGRKVDYGAIEEEIGDRCREIGQGSHGGLLEALNVNQRSVSAYWSPQMYSSSPLSKPTATLEVCDRMVSPDERTSLIAATTSVRKDSQSASVLTPLARYRRSGM